MRIVGYIARRLRCLLAGTVFSVVAPLPLAAADYDKQHERLEELREQLEAVEQRLAADRAKRDEVDEQLRRLDRQVNETVERLGELRDQRRELRHRIEQLEEDYAQEQKRLREQRRALREQIISAYAANSGGGTRFKMLLNETDPATAQRLLTYYAYFHEARTERIDRLLEQLTSLAELRRKLEAERGELAALQEDVEHQRDKLQVQRRQRNQYRKELERRIAERGRSAAELKEDVAEKESLLEELRQRLDDVPEDFNVDDLVAAKGRLPWPVEGDLEAEFGDSRGGGLTHTGIIIGAPRKSEVEVVGPGRVVFSDWLRGLGLLVIIDHGDGYITLYGHNEALYVELGDWVETGDRIATVGSSGARQSPGLYFEIRRGEKPQNPITWLR